MVTGVRGRGRSAGGGASPPQSLKWPVPLQMVRGCDDPPELTRARLARNILVPSDGKESAEQAVGAWSR